MAANEFEYHTIRLGVRPARVAVTIGRVDGWEPTALRAIETLTATWGGVAGIIVPADQAGEVHPTVWTAVEVHDPDLWAAYAYTYRGAQMANPEGYEKLLAREVASFLEKYGGDPESVREQIDDSLRRTTRGGWPPPDEPFASARRYSAPEWHKQFGHAERIEADERPSGRLVDATRLTPLPEQLVVPDTSLLPAQAQVLIAMRWGRLAPSAISALVERGVDLVDLKVDENQLRLVIGAAWANPSSRNLFRLDRLLAEVMEVPDNQAPFHASDRAGRIPSQLSIIGCNWFRRAPYRYSISPVVIVVGDTVDDFAYAYALDRCLGNALWFPPKLSEIVGRSEMIQDLAQACWTHRDPSRGPDQSVNVTSCSLPPEEVLRVCEESTASGWPGSDKVVPVEFVELPYLRPLTLMDADQYESVDEELFIGEVTARGLQTRIPSKVRPDTGVSELKWWVDAIRTDHQLPSRWALNEHLVARSGGWESHARASRDGISYESHPSGFVLGGTPLERVVDRPQLRYLSVRQVFAALAADAGLTLTDSAAGLYTTRTLDLWGSREQLLEDLKDPFVRRILDGWLSKAPSGVEPGNLIVDRRYLSYDDLGRVAGDGELGIVLDRLLRINVARRGLSLSCPHCSNFAWYDADDVGRSFRCSRCRVVSVIDSGSLRGPSEEPAWYYQLAEVVYQAVDHDFVVPLLAVDSLVGGSSSAFSMFDQDVVVEGEKVEVDLWAIVDGRIVIGEAKSNGDLGQRKERNKKAHSLRRVADALTVDRVVFGTATSAWLDSSVLAIDSAFKGARAEVEYLVSVDPTTG